MHFTFVLNRSLLEVLVWVLTVCGGVLQEMKSIAPVCLYFGFFGVGRGVKINFCMHELLTTSFADDPVVLAGDAGGISSGFVEVSRLA